MPPVAAPTAEGLPFRISLEAANRAVGMIALGLPFVLFTVGLLGIGCGGLDSISHYYYTPLGGDLFTGALFIIGVVMAFFYKLPRDAQGRVIEVRAYRGHGIWDFRAARIAGLMAFLVALFPTSAPGCERYAGGTARAFLTDMQGVRADGTVTGLPGFDFLAATGWPDALLGWLHYGAAGVMFAVLAWFSLVVFPRVQIEDAEPITRGSPKWTRNLLYRICGAVIVVAMLAIAWKELFLPQGSAGRALWNHANLTFWAEYAALMAFGLSWSVKGRIFNALRDPGDLDPKAAAAAQARAA